MRAFLTVWSWALGLFSALMIYGWIAQKVQERQPLVAALMMLPVAAFGLSLAPVICIRLLFGLTIATYSSPVVFIVSFVVSAMMLRRARNREE